jgi:hypothetical protein
VARGLSHFSRVTRQDNVVARALLEKAIAIDSGYGQASGVLAASHTFCAHMGWEDRASVAQIAEHAALSAIRADGEDPWAHLAPSPLRATAHVFAVAQVPPPMIPQVEGGIFTPSSIAFGAVQRDRN